MELDVYPIPNPKVVGRVVDSGPSQKTEAVLVLPDKGQVKVLNEVGARIWQLADGKRTLRQIAAQLCEEYQVEEAQAELDTQNFIADLIERGVITLADQAA